MVFVDNAWGINVQSRGETELSELKFYNSFVYGESDDIAEDCPDSNGCICIDKFGLLLFSANQGGKDIHITSASKLPMMKIKSASAWGGVAYIDNVTFANFKNHETKCGKHHAIFNNHKYAPDYIPIHNFKSCTFKDIGEDSVAYFKPPLARWATIDDCGEWPCTGPENIVLTFEGSKFEGTTPSYVQQNGAITYAVGDDPFYNCDHRDKQNAWFCSDRNLGVLLFESLDSDKWDRSIQPVYITDEEGNYSVKLNSFMDHVWDGFYTGQVRLSRFPA